MSRNSLIETGAKSEFHVYIVYEINLWPFTIGQDVTLGNCLVGGVKLTTNADPDQHKYSAYSIGFDASGSFPLSNGSGFGKNVITFAADMSSSVYIDCKKKDILILGKNPTQWLVNTTMNEEKKYL